MYRIADLSKNLMISDLSEISYIFRSVKKNFMFSDLPEISSFRALRNLIFQICQRFHVSGLLEISGFSPLRTRDKTKTDDGILQCWFR
jgi:hypothetical protein